MRFVITDIFLMNTIFTNVAFETVFRDHGVRISGFIVK